MNALVHKVSYNSGIYARQSINLVKSHDNSAQRSSSLSFALAMTIGVGGVYLNGRRRFEVGNH